MLNSLILTNINWLLPALIFLFAMLTIIFWEIKAEKKLKNYLAHPKQQRLLFAGSKPLLKKLGKLSLVLAVITIFALFLRICYGEEDIKLDQNGRHILFVLDISRSMLATDVSSNNNLSRLDFAKIKIKALVENLGPERVGLLLFAEKATLQCPFTRDIRNFFAFLDQIDSQSVSSSSKTDIGSAFFESIKIFNQVKVQNPILILFSDGEDFSETSFEKAKKAKESGITFFGFGVGTEKGGPVPILNDSGQVIGHEKDVNGKIILTKLNQKWFNEVIKNLGGQATQSTFSNSDILAAKNFIEKIEKEKFEDESFKIHNETYPFFALLTLSFLLIETLTKVL